MNKIIGYIVKIAGLVITAPVTWGVAGTVFSDIQPSELRFLIQVAALLVVEGVFVTSWLALDQDRTAPDPIKWRNAGTAWIMYLGLWALALQHGESWAGIVFRLALGLALAGSTMDAGIYTMIQQNTRADRDTNNDRKVKKTARELAKADRILELKLSSDLNQSTMKLHHDVEKTITERQIVMDRNHRMQELKRAESSSNYILHHSDDHTVVKSVKLLKNGNPRFHESDARKRRKELADDRQTFIADLLRESPELSDTHLHSVIRDQFKVSHPTARKDVRAFHANMIPVSSGNGHGGVR